MYRDSKNYIYLEPEQEHKYTVVWLHGLGDSAAGFVDVFYNPQYQVVPNIAKVVLMTAPVRAVTLNNGMEMTSWYDILSLETLGASKNIDMEQLKGNDFHTDNTFQNTLLLTFI